MAPLALVLEGAGLAGLFLCALTDFKSRVIPNALVLWVVGAGGFLRVLTDGSAAWLSFALAVALFILLAILASRGVVGGGDAKLIPATVLLVEPAHVADLLLSITVAGGILGIGYIIAGLVSQKAALWRFARSWMSRFAPLATAIGPKLRPRLAHIDLPYGVAIFAGAALTLLWLQ